MMPSPAAADVGFEIQSYDSPEGAQVHLTILVPKPTLLAGRSLRQ
jgi:hypothetical protein